VYGNEWQVYGLEISGAGDNGLVVWGSSNVIERCVIHDCRDTGLQIYPGAGSNLILNCDSYRNFDTGTHGENADGFGAKYDIGSSNVFRGCRSWENADDGWDLWESTNTVVLDNCWTFRNGTNLTADPLYSGDGNGFKLGGNGVACPHIITRCVAFGNRHSGFDQNNNPAAQSLDQNTAWGNLVYNFNLNHGGVVTSIHVLRNNLSLGGTVQVQANAVQLSNSWQIVTSASTNDVLSIDTSFAQAQRRDDGSLPETPFLRPIPGGRLIDRGTDLGSAFFGTAPDLGAFESPAW
jgi:hypothetical protein